MSETSVASARVQHIERPIVSPGVCGICGKDKHPKGFVDPRLDFEWYGTLYFCADCVVDLAAPFGYITEETYADMKRANEQLRETVERYEAHLAQLAEKVLLGVSDINDRSTSDDTTGPLDDVSVLQTNDEGEPEQVNFVVGEKSERTVPTLQLVSGEGADGVPSVTGGDETGPLGL
jgi:hypothetical protein